MAFNRNVMCLLASLCCCVMNAVANEPVNAGVGKSAKFSIQFEKELLYRKNEKVSVRHWNEYITWKTWPLPLQVVPANNRFSFEIPALTGIARIHVTVPSLRSQDVFRWQIMEPGDSVHLNISSDNEMNMRYTFTGRGVEKYRFAAELYWNDTEKLMQQVMGKGPDLTRKKAQLDSLLHYQLGRLKTYKNITPAVKKLLAWEVRGNLYRAFVLHLYYNFRYAALKPADILPVLDGLTEAGKLQDPLFLKAGSYIEYLYEKEKLKLVCLKGDYWTDKVMGFQFTDLYQQLKVNYSGIVREKLLAYALIDPNDVTNFFGGTGSAGYTGCLQDAWQLTTTPYLKEALRDKMQPYKMGSTVFDFAMPDTAGRIVNLHDFKGKVVLIDVWGYHCGPCQEFRRMFAKEVYPSLQEDTGFVFVSMSTDKPSIWKDALNMDGQSRPGYVNVGSAGMRFDHPFFTYYKVFIIPYLMLVDRNGKLAAIDLPPGIKADALLKLIKETLNRPLQ